MLVDSAIGVFAIGEEAGSFVPTGLVLPYWVTINGLIEGTVRLGSISVEHSIEGTTRARCVAVNPVIDVREGMSLSVVDADNDIFSGLIKTVTVESDQAETVKTVSLEADGWDLLLSRRLVTQSLASITTRNAILGMLAHTELTLDGVELGMVDEGQVLRLVDADHVRASDYVRDVGRAGGGTAYIDDHKKIQFRPTSVDYATVAVSNATVEQIVRMSELDQYRNRQIVRVTGLDGSTIVTETRDDLVEQAARIADEGGSGIYEEFVSITHPTSSVAGELSILGQTVAFVQLRTYGKNARRVTVTMRGAAPSIGQLVDVNLPGFAMTGQFRVMRHTQHDDEAGQWLIEVELWETSFKQLVLESLLNIVGAGKAVVSIDAALFPNVLVFTTPGADTWTVPDGVTTAQFTAWGGSAGGGGGLCSIGGPWYGGGRGGTSGKAVTIKTVVPTDVWDIVVGAKGAGGVGLQDGANGGDSKVSLSAVVACQGNKSTGGKQVCDAPECPSCATGARGTDGGGIGDAIVVGGGKQGGAGSVFGHTNGYPGLNGAVEVRW